MYKTIKISHSNSLYYKFFPWWNCILQNSSYSGVHTNFQPRNFTYIRLLNKPYENEVTLRGQNLSLKCYQPLQLLVYFGKGFRYFHRGNIGSLCQRATNSLAVKDGDSKEKVFRYGHSGRSVCRSVWPLLESAQGGIILKVWQPQLWSPMNYRSCIKRPNSLLKVC